MACKDKTTIFEVTWYDAHFNSGVMDEVEIEVLTKPYIMSDVGYYAGENGIDFKIAQELHYDDDENIDKYGHIMSIPKSLIIKKTAIVSISNNLKSQQLKKSISKKTEK